MKVVTAPEEYRESDIEKYKIIQKQRRIVKIADLSSVEGAHRE